MCFSDCIGCDRDWLPWKAYCCLCMDRYWYSQLRYWYSTLTVLIQSVTVLTQSVTFIWQKKGLPALCSVLPPASNVVYFAVLQPGLFSMYCLMHCTLQPQEPPSVDYLRHSADLPYHCNQSCHQFVAKQTLMSFITGLGYFVSWGNYNAFLFWMLSLVSCWELLLSM